MPNSILDNLPDQTEEDDTLSGLPDQAPVEPDIDKKSEGEAMMGAAWKTAQDIGHVYPVAEAAAHIITNLYGLPISGLVGLAGLIGGTDTSQKWSEFTSDLLIYKPKTQRGESLTSSTLYPFEMLQKGGKYAGDKAYEFGAPWYVSAGIKTLIEGAPAVIGLRHAPKVVRGAMDTLTKSNTWRQATIKERGLVVQTLEEVMAKNPELTEAQLIKKSDAHFREALNRRMVKKKQEATQTKETARKMGEEVKETEPVVQEVSPQVKEIFQEVTKPKPPIGKKATTLKPPPEAKVAEPISSKDISEYEQLSGEASRRAEANIEKHYRALVEAEFIPKGVDPESLRADVTRMATIEEEINVLNEILKPFPTDKRGRQLGDTIAKGIKKDIRTSSGQIKVKDIVAVDQREGLKTQIKLEAAAARDAFSAGKTEATLAHKLKQRELLIRQRANKLQGEAIKKMVKDIKGLKLSKMSPQAAEPIKELIRDIDFTRISAKKKLRLEGLRRHLEENPEAELPSGRFAELSRLDKWNLKDITFDDLVAIHESVMHYAHLDKLKNKIKVGRELRRTEEVLEGSISEMKPTKDIQTDIVTSQRGGKPVKNTGDLIKNTFGIRHDHYDLVIESLAGPNSTMDKVLYQGVKEGIIKQYDYRQKAFDKFLEDIKPTVKKVGDVDSWLGELVRTGRFQLTRNERMSLYRHSLNEDNKVAILKGGVGFRQSVTPDRVWKITLEELDSIIESLTKEELEFAGTPVDNLFNNQSDAISEVFYEKNGYPFPTVENYYPKQVMPRALGSSEQQEIALDKYRGKFVRVGIEKGMLIERVGSELPVYLNPLTTDLNKSILRSAAYVGLEIPLSNASKLLYNKEFRAELSNRYGDIVWKEIEKALRDIVGEYKGYTTVEELMMKAKNNLSTAVLGLNPFVMAKQVLSLPVYLPYIDAAYLTQGMGEYLLDRKGVMARHRLYSPEYVERISGGFSRDVADVFKAGSEKRLYGGKKKLKEVGMSGIKLFDEVAVSAGMQGGVLMVLDQFKAGKLSEQVRVALNITDADIPNLSASDKMRLAYRYVDYATERTQPMFSPEHLSSLQRGSTAEKLFTMFGSFTNQALNLIRRASRDYSRAKTEQQKSAAASKIAKVLFALAVLNPLGVFAIDTMRDKLYDKENTGSFLGRLVQSYASYVFFLRDIASSVISKMERGTYQGYGVDIPVMAIPNLAIDAFTSGYESLYAPKATTRLKAGPRFVDKSLQLIFTMNGIPYSTPKKVIGATIDKIQQGELQ